ncbi:MAG: AAA family ATPase [Candidatus Peribacteraceae bacterium]|nr:AAA family ATPase [Candidatus Peribacteraceae bacterium]
MKFATLGKDEYLWSQSYRPKKIDDVVIPDNIKKQFKAFINEKQIPNLLLTSSSPGTGKTTTALALCDEIGCKPLFINASLDNGVDTLRNKVLQYTTTSNIMGDAHKIVILDEADRLSDAAQQGLKGIMELVSKSARFILTANNKMRVVEPLRSRCVDIEFAFGEKEKKQLMLGIFSRVKDILDIEKIEYEPKALLGVVNRFFPDNRKVISEIQRYSKSGKIDAGILGALAGIDIDQFVKAMKGKDFGSLKTFCFENADKMSSSIYNKMFKTLETEVTPQSQPQIVLILGDYQRYHSIVPDLTIHMLAMVTEIMMQAEFK